MATTTTAVVTDAESIRLSNFRVGLGSHRAISKNNEENSGIIQQSNASAGFDNVSEAIPDTPSNPTKKNSRGHIQFAALCFCLFLAGWNDGTTGPLLPRIQKNYHVNFAVVSLLFVCACIGFIIGGLSNVFFTERLGFGKVNNTRALSQVIGYVLMVPAPPFPVLVIGYIVNGFGIALQDAQANGFVAAQEGDGSKMNFLHAAYGFGAMSAPLIATQFAQLHHWSFYYFTSLGLSIANVIFLGTTFKLRTQDVILAKNGYPAGEANTSQQSTMRQILSTKSVHLLAFFILVYVGIEVTIGGWIVTFIIDKRGGGANSGYISTGFFGGLTAGRLVLHYATRLVAERHTIYAYAILCIALELIIWFVPSLVGNAVSVSLIGFFLGPMYPAIMNQAGGILPRWLLTGSIGWIAGFGQAGSALLPFMTGALASKFGISSLQPLTVAAIVLMIFLWVLVPKSQRRLD
ncbi:MFS general substrate transporter [Hysterangium stoloniferum]|nr:MFS general substrate transporter [Hysterangium stoloniferum]